MATAAVNERLAALTAAGTSIWLDQIRRSLIEGGELARMVREDCLRGVTSNPAIFEKAILGSEDYDEAFKELAEAGLDTRDVYRRLAIDDVRAACDVLRPVYDETEHYDGYVSLEVDPDLAFDTALTIAQAREYWDAVDRPNLMIKIPGTDEGLPAITETLAAGINVNVTLLFSVAQYKQVMAAHIAGMQRLREAGESLDVHSVASFFVSRVDTEVDKRLDAAGNTELQGKAGLANAQAAYQAYKAVYHGDDYAALREAGAPVQRPLWASTGVKNPSYPATMYVYGLVAPETVNTMPMATLDAAAQEGEVSGATADQDPTEDLQALAAAGIDLDDVTAKLLRDGVDAFVTPMKKLLAGIESRREAIVTGRPASVDADLPFELEPAVGARVRSAVELDVARRMWRRDDTLWGKPGQPEVSDRLGWLTIGERMDEEALELMAFAREVWAEGIGDVVLLGMGGSSLAPEVFRRSLAAAGEAPAEAARLHVLDTTDPGAVADVEAALGSLDKTLFIVSTKSGGTIETLSLAKYFLERAGGGENFVAITDPGSSLLDFAAEHGFRRSFENDPDIGGRYSALSYFGLVPAALAGVDVSAVLERAAYAVSTCSDFDSHHRNSGLWFGCALGELALHGRDKLTFIIDPPVDSFGVWAEQLIAESLGKDLKGILPIADEPIGEPEAYGRDRVFIHLRGADGTHDDAVAALQKAGQPVIRIQQEGVADLGRNFFIAEFATAVAGWVLQVNSFDQPNVALAKANTQAVLEHYESEGSLPEIDENGDLPALLAGVGPCEYVAVLGYLAPDAGVDAAVADLRERIRARTQAATTFGYGPRYLHSTGQLHKGGQPTGHFVVLLHDRDGGDLDIPGAPYSFATLKNAQAIGDVRTLGGVGRPVIAIRLSGDDPAADIRALEVE